MKAGGFHTWRFGAFVVWTTTILQSKTRTNSAQKVR